MSAAAEVLQKTKHRHVVILAHPGEESFNATIAQTYIGVVREYGHEAELRDLYRMDFDPVLRSEEIPTAENFSSAKDVDDELELIRDADVYVLVYPIWFGGPPAILKGYVERVLGKGFDHRAIRDRKDHSFLNGKHLLSFSSSGSSIQWLDEQGAWLALRESFDHYIARAFSMRSDEHIHLSNIVGGLSERHVREELEHVKAAALNICSELEVDYSEKSAPR